MSTAMTTNTKAMNTTTTTTTTTTTGMNTPTTKPEVLATATWNSMEKVSSELFALTHGAFVRQILRDHEDDVEAVNAKLDQLGRNIGTRIIEEYLARTNASSSSSGGACASFEAAMEMTAKVGLKMFLNATARTRDWSEERDECVIEMDNNPLADFVELPTRYRELAYCNMLCGAIRGALETVRMRTTCSFEGDPLRGMGDKFVIRVKLVELVPEEYPYDE
jgi:hypothetical protein